MRCSLLFYLILFFSYFFIFFPCTSEAQRLPGVRKHLNDDSIATQTIFFRFNALQLIDLSNPAI
jgi:hypothetical protein